MIIFLDTNIVFKALYRLTKDKKKLETFIPIIKSKDIFVISTYVIAEIIKNKHKFKNPNLVETYLEKILTIKNIYLYESKN